MQLFHADIYGEVRYHEVSVTSDHRSWPGAGPKNHSLKEERLLVFKEFRIGGVPSSTWSSTGALQIALIAPLLVLAIGLICRAYGRRKFKVRRAQKHESSRNKPMDIAGECSRKGRRDVEQSYKLPERSLGHTCSPIDREWSYQGDEARRFDPSSTLKILEVEARELYGFV